MPDKLHNHHQLVSDVTPWWWRAHWGQDEMQRAVNALLTTRKFAIDRIVISREQLQVEFALGVSEDVNRTQERVEALKDVLDEMVAA